MIDIDYWELVGFPNFLFSILSLMFFIPESLTQNTKHRMKNEEVGIVNPTLLCHSQFCVQCFSFFNTKHSTQNEK